jgi:hypothetical protein
MNDLMGGPHEMRTVGYKPHCLRAAQHYRQTQFCLPFAVP